MSTTAMTADEKVLMSKYRRLVFASAFGTGLENYDMFIYAMVAPLVFDTLFFPKVDPYVGTLLVFATFAIGFLVRPLGSVVFGHFGDKLGRKKILIITLMMMGIATICMGLLPGYSRLGIWATGMLLFLRICQGFALGGETGGANVLALENAPQKKRGFYTSCVQIGAPLGVVFASFVISVCTGLAGKQAFQAWVWRVPFLLSAALVILGVYMRANIDESFIFAHTKKRVGAPIAEVLRNWKKSLIYAMLSVMAQGTFFYLVSIFGVAIASRRLGMSQSYLTAAVLVANCIALFTVPLYGYISDRTGRRPVLLVGIVLCAAFIYPFLAVLTSRNQPLLAICIVAALGIIQPLILSMVPAFTSELWPTHVRYTGASVSSHVGSAIGGGLAPLIAASLMGRSLNFTPVALYYIGIAVLAFIGILLAPESSKLVLSADKWTTEAELAQPQQASAK